MCDVIDRKTLEGAIVPEGRRSRKCNATTILLYNSPAPAPDAHPILPRVPHVAERGARVILRVPSARLCITFSPPVFLALLAQSHAPTVQFISLRARDVTTFLSSHYTRRRSNVRDIMPAVAERCLYRAHVSYPEFLLARASGYSRCVILGPRCAFSSFFFLLVSAACRGTSHLVALIYRDDATQN